MSNAENSGKTAFVPRGRPFQPGVSGNPGGRPRVSSAVRALFREHAPEALGVLVGLMRTSKNEKMKMSAAVAILDRAFGKFGGLDADTVDDAFMARIAKFRFDLGRGAKPSTVDRGGEPRHENDAAMPPGSSPAPVSEPPTSSGS